LLVLNRQLSIDNRQFHMCDSDHHPEHISTVEHLAEHLRPVLTDRSVLVCVGSELNGDDAAGPAVAGRVAGKVRWLVLDVQGVPESFLMKVVAARPDTVLVIDALDFDAPGGAVELFAPDAVTGQGPSTHGPAPVAFLDLLRMMHPCRQVILGIQPVSTEVGQGISQPVRKGIDLVVEALLGIGGLP
jgi:hydrogenase maturation protease